MARTSSHKIETRSRDIIRKRINEFDNGNALFRELSERDYGIDAVIEIFDNGNPTGKFALLQIKGTEKPIVNLKNKPVVPCSISSPNAKYALQKIMPVMLIYVSLYKNSSIYYGEL